MNITMDVSLDPTLGCGQAHRWVKKGDLWEGVLGERVITLKENDDGFECFGTSDRRMILDYFRYDDDIDRIYEEISCDSVVSELIRRYRGLRILRQDPWECTATYLLATNANVKRIAVMVDNVCREFGTDLGGRFSFPGPEDILNGPGDVCRCRLGYRDVRLTGLAGMVADNELDLEGLRKAGYRECVETLKTVDGIGDKVADCIALFSYGHLEAFPVDARIRRRLSEIYCIEGSYAKVSGAAREKFGRYGGYAQEFLYHGTS
jgi:N-glycosylase/DNA lyase